jgi:hypothetical protein
VIDQEQKQATNNVNEHQSSVENPQEVEISDDFLKLRWDVNLDVMIETRLLRKMCELNLIK